ncbi:MAG TPA: winged helix-turn-helix domain-containing protein, partial [Acidimicrobiales bacterium]|nr:winged helix-turn-helix domain-containing protein [Acidimicrobiales bacterium]
MASTSAAALAFLEEALPADGDGRLTMSQAELARQTGRSPGTVAYYLSHAGPGVVTRRRDGVLV